MTAPDRVQPRHGTPRGELVMYGVAAATYIAMGFLVKQVFAWWWFGAIWLIGFVHYAPRASAWARSRFLSGGDPAREGPG